MKDIKTIFDRLLGDKSMDQQLIGVLRRYEQRFINKNEHHINFFGGVLMGVNPVRFTQDDRTRWFDEILGVDEQILKEALYKSPSINQSWIVSSDIMNLSCFYLMHRFLSDKRLTEKQKEEGALNVALIMNYKFFTSVLSGWFTYNANPVVAQTTYAMLTKKFGLKLAGSWGALIRNRSMDIVKKGGLHYKVLVDGYPDDKVINVINDIWGRVKSILKYIRDVFTQAQNMPEYQIQTASNTIVLDGEVRLRDKSRVISQHLDYGLNIIQDQRSFVKKELVDVVMYVMGNVPIKRMEDVLTYMVNNASIKADKDVQTFVTTVIEHGINYIVQNPGVMRNNSDLANLVRKMKGLYTAAKSTDPYVMKIRQLGDKLAERGGKTKNKQVVAALRTAVALYVMLRTQVMHHYKR